MKQFNIVMKYGVTSGEISEAAAEISIELSQPQPNTPTNDEQNIGE